MRVSLFVTCLVDQLWPSIGEGTVEVLERAGCEVVFDARQTCCGQPAFNAGYRKEAAEVARHFLDVYADVDAIVMPSGSCAAMTHHQAELFPGDAELQARARRVAERTHDLASFLVHVLGKPDLGARFDGRVTWHDACHGLRELGVKQEPRTLLANVAGLELVEAKSCDSCCGFGGTFSVDFAEISVAMVDRKIEELSELGVDAVVSGDASCLMQLGGRLEKLGSPVRALHLAEVLAGR